MGLGRRKKKAERVVEIIEDEGVPHLVDETGPRPWPKPEQEQCDCEPSTKQNGLCPHG